MLVDLLAPWWAKALLVAAVLAALTAGVLAYNRHQQGIGEDRIYAKWGAETVARQRAAIKAQDSNAAETERRLAKQAEVIDEQAQKLAQALADNDSLRTAGQRLRAAQSAAIGARGRGPASDPATASTSTSADAPGDLLADVQRRLDEATDGVAGFADASHIAGTTCERSYDALNR